MAIIDGGNGKDLIEGTPGSDDLFGGNGKDQLFGELFNDNIDGGNGKDVIAGGDDLGDDTIEWTGSTLTAFSLGDVLTTGNGADTVLFDGNDDDHDLVTDFKPGTDRLVISDTTFAEAQQVVITDGLYGPGLLIVTDLGNDDGLFLQGVTAPLTLGSDLFFV